MWRAAIHDQNSKANNHLKQNRNKVGIPVDPSRTDNNEQTGSRAR